MNSWAQPDCPPRPSLPSSDTAWHWSNGVLVSSPPGQALRAHPRHAPRKSPIRNSSGPVASKGSYHLAVKLRLAVFFDLSCWTRLLSRSPFWGSYPWNWGVHYSFIIHESGDLANSWEYIHRYRSIVLRDSAKCILAKWSKTISHGKRFAFKCLKPVSGQHNNHLSLLENWREENSNIS